MKEDLEKNLELGDNDKNKFNSENDISKIYMRMIATEKICRMMNK